MGTTLSTLKPPAGARRKRKRVGRGPGSGKGKTAGRGHKGQKARSGGKVARGFEGGQMPLKRRVPKRGFRNIFRIQVDEVNLDALERVFDAGEVDPTQMRAQGVVPRKAVVIKVLGRGELSKALTVKAHRFSKTARQKIEAAGGTVQVLAEKRAPQAAPEPPAEATE
jgi:large subunit ribosomal protein L15